MVVAVHVFLLFKHVHINLPMVSVTDFSSADIMATNFCSFLA